MIVCPDCRKPLPCSCGWVPVRRDGIEDYLSSRDRSSAETASYIETYDLLAERNKVVPVDSDRYVEHMSRQFVSVLGGLAGKDICDVGSGRGYFVKHALRQNPNSLTAVDIAARSLRTISEKYPVRAFLANAENLPFEREFDVLAATDILEHVLNVSNFLVCANWALRDGGILGIRVPYLENMLWYSNFHGLPVHFTHLRTFDRLTLVDLVSQAGFEISSVHYDGFHPGFPQPFWSRFPKIRDRLIAGIRRRFGHDDDVTTINEHLGRLILKPIEVGVVAVKTVHIETVNAHESLTKFKRERATVV